MDASGRNVRMKSHTNWPLCEIGDDVILGSLCSASWHMHLSPFHIFHIYLYSMYFVCVQSCNVSADSDDFVLAMHGVAGFGPVCCALLSRMPVCKHRMQE